MATREHVEQAPHLHRSPALREIPGKIAGWGREHWKEIAATSAPLALLAIFTADSIWDRFISHTKTNTNTPVAGNPTFPTPELGVITGPAIINGETVTVVSIDTATSTPRLIETSTPTSTSTATTTSTPIATKTPDNTSTPTATPTPQPTEIPEPTTTQTATSTPKPQSTNTLVPPTPTETSEPPTKTPIPPTATAEAPTHTPVPPTATIKVEQPADTAVPPTATSTKVPEQPPAPVPPTAEPAKEGIDPKKPLKDATKADLAERLGVSPETITSIVYTNALIWRKDGVILCPGAGPKDGTGTIRSNGKMISFYLKSDPKILYLYYADPAAGDFVYCGTGTRS